MARAQKPRSMMPMQIWSSVNRPSGKRDLPAAAADGARAAGHTQAHVTRPARQGTSTAPKPG